LVHCSWIFCSVFTNAIIMSKKIPNNLLEQNSALGNYLDDMLHQATESALVDTVEPIDENLLPETLLLEDEAFAEDTISIAVDNSAIADLQPVTESEPEQTVELAAELFPLQFLMFKVGDNLLSMPLIKMSNVINWTDSLTRLPNEPDWVHGILQHRDNKVRIVDSPAILQIGQHNAEKPSNILILEGESWGITCDAIENVITLEYDDIQWNLSAGNQMTLGTIRDSLASLLSPRGIIERLQSGH
jgi:purine-binding chemotaxis protein CheW